MARCEGCIHQECCVRFAGARTLLCGDKADERCKLFKSTADVVPKSEVEKLEQDNEDLRNILTDTLNKYRNCETEVARKIFEEIGKILYKYDKVAERDKSEYGELIIGDIGFAITELKKKYENEVPIVRDLAEEAVDRNIQNYFDIKNATIIGEDDILDMLRYPEKYVTPEAQIPIVTFPDEASAGEVLRIGIVYDEDTEAYSIYTEDDLGMDFTNPCEGESLVDTFVRALNGNLKREA